MRTFANLFLGCGVLLIALSAIPAAAEDASSARVTFTKDVLPILQENCAICHREAGTEIAGMVAPMSLLTYREVRPWSKAILKQVQARQMPPWDASAEFNGHFMNERTLTDEEIATFEKWVAGGALRGNPADAPPPFEFESSSSWAIGEPDLIVYMPEPYWVADEIRDVQPRFLAKISEEQLPENRWIRSVEWRADSDIVHHIVGGSTAPDEVEFPDGTNRQSLGSIAPGEDPTIYPEGYGKLLHKGSTIRFGMHYHKEPGPGTGQWDQSMIGFRFWDPETDPPVQHQVHWNGISGRNYEIPPNQANWPVGAARTFPEETTILSFHPHMHLRGKDMKYTAYYPDGTQEVLLHVPAYDYDWQSNYIYTRPKQLPAGTRVEVTGHYDNSVANLRNPDADQTVRPGAATTDEMFIGFISYTATEPLSIEESQRQLGLAGSGD